MNVLVGNILSFIGGLIDFGFDLKYNEKKKILQGNFVSITFSIIAYIFLKAYDAIVNAIVTLFRLITIYIKDKFNKNYSFLFIVFICLYALVFIKYSGIKTIILFISSMCSFIPKWLSKDMQKIRLGGIFAYIFAIIYNVMISNYAVIIIEVISMLLIAIAFIRWYKKEDTMIK